MNVRCVKTKKRVKPILNPVTDLSLAIQIYRPTLIIHQFVGRKRKFCLVYLFQKVIEVVKLSLTIDKRLQIMFIMNGKYYQINNLDNVDTLRICDLVLAREYDSC